MLLQALNYAHLRTCTYIIMCTYMYNGRLSSAGLPQADDASCGARHSLSLQGPRDSSQFPFPFWFPFPFRCTGTASGRERLRLARGRGLTGGSGIRPGGVLSDVRRRVRAPDATRSHDAEPEAVCLTSAGARPGSEACAVVHPDKTSVSPTLLCKYCIRTCTYMYVHN